MRQNKQKNKGEDRQIGVGIVGLGYWGPKLARNIHELPMGSLKIIVDLRQDRLLETQKLFPETRMSCHIEDLFCDEIEAVMIATPVSAHFSLAKLALEAGKHVFVEKPLTNDSRGAQELIDIAHRNNLTLMVGHTFQYNPAVEAVREIIQSGELGKILYLNSIRVNLGLLQPDINVMWDLAPHDLSILRFILNEDPIEVSVFGGSYVNQIRRLHEVVYMNLVFHSGILCNLRVSWLDPVKQRQLTVVGGKKMLVYDDIADDKVLIYDKGVEVPPYSVTEDEFHASYRNGAIVNYPIEWVEPLRAQCAHFLNCITNGTVPRSSGEDGLKVVKILETAQRSLENDGVVLRIEY